MLIPLAVLAAGMSAYGYEHEASSVAPILLVLWGSVGVLEYAKGEAIQVTWYRVAPEASNGEKFLHLLLAIILILLGVGILFKHVF